MSCFEKASTNLTWLKEIYGMALIFGVWVFEEQRRSIVDAAVNDLRRDDWLFGFVSIRLQ